MNVRTENREVEKIVKETKKITILELDSEEVFALRLILGKIGGVCTGPRQHLSNMYNKLGGSLGLAAYEQYFSISDSVSFKK